MADITANPDNYMHCDENGPAFDSDGLMASSYVLEQQVTDDASDSSELAMLMVESGSTGMFYTMDPTFFSIMKILSSSIALSMPYEPSYFGTDADSQYRYRESTTIYITINTELDEMPCRDDAVYALRSVLMWVSFSINSPIANSNEQK